MNMSLRKSAHKPVKAGKAATKTVAKKAVAKRTVAPKFKITYATLGVPNPELHDRFDQALEHVRAGLEQSHPMFIGGRPVTADETFEDRSPINRDWLLGRFQKGTAQHARDALAAARKAVPVWSNVPWKERVKILRRAASLIEKRIYDLSALTSLEVGKNRLEAIGDVQETADLIYYYCDQMETNGGFIKPMGKESPKHSNTSVLRPYGVWVVISPFNFPFALAGGPSGAALVAGNTVVFKPATDTAYTGLEVARCFLDAGLPEGVFNLVTGPGSTVGNELITNPEVDGITFTGSYDVGMHIYRTFANGRYPRPCIVEMGGKNPTIISRKADLDLAAAGVMRSAFGLQGQKCSACSRIFIERPVREAFTEKLLALTEKVRIGNPTQRDVWFGPVIDQSAYMDYINYCDELGQAGKILTGGRHLIADELGKGYFCAPTIVDELPVSHPLWKHEMFLPITVMAAVDSLDEAMQRANDVEYGLTAGFYSADPAEIEWFFKNIQAGVTYVNRQAGATTGAWPGYQPFGGWKGSGSTGRAGGGLYYVLQYMHEQSRTLVMR
jgi:1-pyrroline-5-carboxylate dehydrogenase